MRMQEFGRSKIKMVLFEVMLVGVGVVGGGAGRESKSIYRVVVLNATDQELSFSSAQIRLVKVERLLR